jgi:hypothetical protein
MRQVAYINLDDYAPRDQTSAGMAIAGAPGGNFPFNRLTGVCLLLDMEYMNYNIDIHSNSGVGLDEWDKKVACIITVSRIGSWCT